MKRNNQLHLLVLALGLLAISQGCAGRAANAKQVMTGGPVARQVLTGRVVEVMAAGGYTYICLERDGSRTWIAVPATRVAVGGEIEALPGTEMGNFTSKSLNLTFASIIFSGGLVTNTPARMPAAPATAQVMNLKVGQDGGKAVATYDLAGEDSEGKAEVSVTITINGVKRPSDQLSLTGDFGPGVMVGPGKRIIWNALADLPPNFDGELGWDVRALGGTNAAHSPVDESTLAHGATPPFYSCNAHADCQTGNVCVDNGGDGHFYCKPLCGSDAACSGWPYPRLGCYEHRRADGTIFPYRVCNDQPSRLRP